VSLHCLIKSFIAEVILTTPPQSWISKPPVPWVDDTEDEPLVDKQDDLEQDDFEQKALKKFDVPEQRKQSDIDYYDVGYSVNPVMFRDR